MSSVFNRVPIIPTEQERPHIEKVDKFLVQQVEASLPKLVSSSGEEVELSESVFRLLHQLVHDLAQGNTVMVVPGHRELTTQEAADLLNVSRQYLVEVLKAGDIPFTLVGTHRRIHFDDLMEYKNKRDAERREGLARLTKKSQELGLYGKLSKAPTV
jgi:excisionase family DNA binding protein